MAVTRVRLNSDVYLVCLSHALVTEEEEVMGLLIGEIDENCVSHISAVIVLRRSDKRKDRVEISPEQLSAASTRAERLAVLLDRPMRVLGWYHSHPHITVLPSHVDVQTQAMYQMMDRGFIGLIFSVFNEDKAKKHGRIQLMCFQSTDLSSEGQPPQYTCVEIPIDIIPNQTISKVCTDALVELPTILAQEELDTYKSAMCNQDTDLITQIHNSAIFTKSICHITESVSIPLLQMLENRYTCNQQRLEQLKRQKRELEEQLR